MENPILISVIIPNFNYSEYIGRCIDSVLTSDFDLSMIEIVFIDDASTDRSVEVILDHMADSEVSFQLIQNDTNLGIVRSRNRGIVHAKGEYLFFLDADNFIHEDCLIRHLEALRLNLDFCAAYAPVQEFDNDSGEPGKLRSNASFDYQRLLGGNYIDAMSMFRMSDMVAVGMYETQMPMGGWEDYELWLRLGKIGKRVFFIEGRPLSSYRIHRHSLTASITEDINVILIIYLKGAHDIQVPFKNRKRVLEIARDNSLLSAQLFFSVDSRPDHQRDGDIKHPSDFSERNSLSKSISTKAKGITFKFDKPEKATRLRFDPVHDLMQIRLFSFGFLLEGESLSIPYTLSSNAYVQQDLVFLFNTADPQIIVDFEVEEAVLMDEVVIEFECLKLGDEVLTVVLERNDEILVDLQDRCRILSENLSESRARIDTWRKKLYQCQQELDYLINKKPDGVRESIVRYLRKQKRFDGILNLWQRLLQKKNSLIIRKSGLFNAEYYLQNNPDVRSAGMDPLDHFLQFGWRERRSPGTSFDIDFYLKAYPDVKRSGMNPLWHYLKHGKAEGRLPKPHDVAGILAPSIADITSYEPLVPISQSHRVAIVCHLFYEEMMLEMFGSFKNMPLPYDLFLTTTAVLEETIRKHAKEELPNVKCSVIIAENRGRDIAPFLSLLSSDLQDYDLVCKIHTKKSRHEACLKDWGKLLIYSLLGNQAIICRILNEFERYPGLGILWPFPHSYLMSLGIGFGWGGGPWGIINRTRAIQEFPELELDELEPGFGFPAGSMFWFRPNALHYFVDHPINSNDFEEENGQLDGTLAHVLERLFGVVSLKHGFFNRTVRFPVPGVDEGKKERHIQADKPARILFIAHDLQKAGAQILLLHIINWLHNHTAIDLAVLALRRGNNSDRLYHEYASVSRLFVWAELVTEHGEDEAVAVLKKELGVVNLIYGNTIISAEIYQAMSLLQAPFLSHIHELEESIRKYSTKRIRHALIQHTQKFIACSAPVLENLRQNHGIPASRIELVNEFIKADIQLPDDITPYKKLLHLPADKVIVWGCGTIYWRKGTDLFIETASILKNKGLDNFLFCWIAGDNSWDEDAVEWGPWKKWEDLISQQGLGDIIYFLRDVASPREYMKAGDIFFLPSREDPFPLVALEAAECALPIVCFEGSGGITAFVEEDAGCIIPYLDTHRAAETIEEWTLDADLRKEKGRNARKKLLQRHTDDITMPSILNICHDIMKTKPLVSVIVPVYNHEAFLSQRMESILKQTFRDMEIIILDDASTDTSFQIAQHYANHPFVKIHRNLTNSGSPFIQWKNGINMARAEFVWIAEGDDSCEPDFLETLLQRLIRDNSVMAYAQSKIMNGIGQKVKDHMRSHTDDLDEERWKTDYLESGEREVVDFLFFRNTIPNGSACLFRRDPLIAVSDELDSYTHSGDWHMYASLLQQGSISYVAKSLNHFRRHETSASLQLKSFDYLDEVLRVREYIAEHYPIDKERIIKMAAFLDKDFPIQGVDRNSAFPDIAKRIEALINKAKED